VTPRIIATVLLRDNTIRIIAGLFVLSFVFSLGLLARSQSVVLYLPLVGLPLLTLSLDRRLSLPDGLCRTAAAADQHRLETRRGGLRVIDEVYPIKLKADYTATPPLPALGQPAHEMFHRRKSAIVLAVNLDS
jgi:hypothetical protein